MAPRTSRRGAERGAVRRRRLPMRYLLPSLVLVALMAMLMLRGYVHSEILADHRVQPPAASDQVPKEILEGGPVIDTRNGREASVQHPGPQAGPDLRRRPGPRVDAQGPRRAQEARRARRLLRHRHHGLALPGPRPAHGRRGPRDRPAHLQPPRPLATSPRAGSTGSCPRTSSALAGAAGIRTSLFRPPYSSFAAAMDNKSWPVTEYIGSRGYITVVNNTDSEDWRAPASSRSSATPRPRAARAPSC